MSRTDVHAPYWVKLRDPGWSRHFVEEHRHERCRCDVEGHLDEDRCCDLEEFLAEPHLTYWQGCYRDFVSFGVNVWCGCRMCTNQLGRRHTRRAERVVVRARLRAAVKTTAADRDSIDVPRPAVARKW